MACSRCRKDFKAILASKPLSFKVIQPCSGSFKVFDFLAMPAVKTAAMKTAAMKTAVKAAAPNTAKA
jgi:hypothetical protein